MINNQLTKETKKNGVVEFEVEGNKITLSPEIVRNQLVSGAGNVTNQEVMYFLALCKARKLNPFVKDVYLIKYGNSQPATMVVAKDVLERRAIKNPQYAGKKVGIYVIDKEGNFSKRDHTILLTGEKLVGAWCEVYRKDWQYPATADVNYNEYVGKKSNGEINGQWAGKPVTMLVKVAKAQALREAFIEELQGMYEAEEMESSVPDIKEVMQQSPIPEDIKEVMAGTKEKLDKKVEEKKKISEQKTIEEVEVVEDDEITLLFGK